MKRLVVCCDGTWNRLDQRARGVPVATNVSKLAFGVSYEDVHGTRQLLHYQRGVGTGRLDRLLGGATGFGLSRNVIECYRFVVEHFEPGDEIFLFGFSRGAFTARSTAGLIRNAGILLRENGDRIDDAYRLYRGRTDEQHPNGGDSRMFRRMHSHPDAEIRLIGVWDTVGALGIPTGALRMPWLTRRWSFHDTELSSAVRLACHALAIDERRGAFRPALWKKGADAPGQTLEQVWFAGVHSDVGGGYPEAELADISLAWMTERARDAGLGFEPDHLQRRAPPIDLEQRVTGSAIAPDPYGAIHESRRGLYRLLPPLVRDVTADGGAIAPEVDERRRSDIGYAPPNL